MDQFPYKDTVSATAWLQTQTARLQGSDLLRPTLGLCGGRKRASGCAQLHQRLPWSVPGTDPGPKAHPVVPL